MAAFCQWVEGRRPLFAWPDVEGATWYQVWIQRNGQKHLSTWVEGKNSWTPGSDLAGGSYQWWVRGWNVDGYGSWSDPAASFSILAMQPGALAQILPQGPQLARHLTYHWDKDARATWYRLVARDVSDRAGVRCAGAVLRRWGGWRCCETRRNGVCGRFLRREGKAGRGCVRMTKVVVMDTQKDLLAIFTQYNLVGRYPDTLGQAPTQAEAMARMREAKGVYEWLLTR